MTDSKTVYVMLQECARDMPGTCSRQQILTWFSAHYPHVPQSTLGAQLQAATSKVGGRALDAPNVGNRPPLFERVGRGMYRVHPATDTATYRTPVRPAANTLAPSVGARRGPQDEWHWEGQVQARVVAHLAERGVAITRVADTASREQGTDIEGVHRGVRIHVEVKGWPSEQYIDPARAFEPKRTSPSLQARVWFADGLMHVLRLRTSYPHDTVALALPKVPTYQRLFDSVRSPVEQAHISVLWVDRDGSVALDAWGAEPD